MPDIHPRARDMQYLVCEVRSHATIAVVGSPFRAYDVSHVFATHTTRDAARYLGVLGWFDQTPKLQADRLARHAAQREEGQILRGWRPQREEVKPYVHEPPAPRETEGIAYAPPLSIADVDALHTWYATHGQADYAAAVKLLADCYARDLRGVTRIPADMVAHEMYERHTLFDRESTWVRLAIRTAESMGLRWFLIHEPPKRRKKAVEPIVRYRADPYAAVSAGTYTPRVDHRPNIRELARLTGGAS